MKGFMQAMGGEPRIFKMLCRFRVFRGDNISEYRKATTHNLTHSNNISLFQLRRGGRRLMIM